jgi:hypothetical protein
MESKFEVFKKEAFGLVRKMGIDPLATMACQYELILESELRLVVDRVVFQAIGYRGGDECITEVRLKQQDLFVCNEWGLFLLNTDMASDVKFDEHTYPDPRYFRKKDVEEAGIFYNADLSFVVNNLIVLPGVKTDRFKVYRDVAKRKEDGISGLHEIEDGPLLLTGSKNINFTLHLPRKTDWMDSPIRLRLRLRGILFMNATMVA